MDPPYVAESYGHGPAAEGLADTKLITGINLMKMFPSLFTMMCGLLFLAPMCIVINIGRSPEMGFFTTHWYWVVLAIPIIIAIVHVIHVRKGAPYRPAVVAALIAPSLILLIIASRQESQAANYGQRLRVADCDSLPKKMALQSAWLAAYELYTRCLNETHAAHPQYSVATLQRNFRIQDCTEYPKALAGRKGQASYAQDWNYLRDLEESQNCAGWCYHGAQLWGSGPSKDSCSVAVSAIFNFYAQPHASQVCTSMMATLFTTAGFLILFGPILRKHITW